MKTFFINMLLVFTATLSFAQVPSYVPTNGLVGWWPFNGNANDESGNGNNGTVNGATLTTDRNGLASKAYSFDGVDDYIDISNNILPTTSTSNTVSLWFKSNDIAAHLLLDRSTIGNVKRIGITINNGGFLAAGGENGNCVAGACQCYNSGTAHSFCDWNHAVVVNNIDANTSKIYLNGILVATRNSFCYTNFSSPTSIGRGNSAYNTNGDAHTNGKIDDVAVWSRALSDSEISNLFQNYIQQGINLSITDTSCNSYVLNGQTYFQSGVYTQNYTTQNGCDSTIVLDLTILNSSGETINSNTCDSFVFNNQTYTQSGTYTQNLTNAAGCDSIITLNLTINQPTTNTITQSSCNSFTLNNQTYTQSGTYTQNLTNAAGCDSIITLNLTINNSPTASSSSTGATFHGATDGTVNLTVSGGAAPYSFNWSNGANTEDLNAVAAGTYNVTITDANNCSSTTSVTVNQPPLALVKSPESLISSALYPNPATAQTGLELQLNQAQDFEITVYNNLGQRIFNKNYSNTKELNENIDMRSWPAGQYFVEIKLPNGTETKKLIKE